MNVSLADVRTQVDELPIGYYAKRRIGMVTDSESDCSFYDPETDEIHISYKQVASGLANANDENEEYKETAIRSMVYHEVSHAILTPSAIFDYCRIKEAHDVMNIFEDERIETVLKDFYMNVNFKKNVLYVNGGKITPPTNAMSAFYNLVRFRVHSNKAFLEEVANIIKTYDSDFYDKDYDRIDRWDLRNYTERVYELYRKVKEDFAKNGASSSPSEDELNEVAEKINSGANSGNGYDKNDQASGTKSKPKTKESEDGENGESGENSEGEDNEGEESLDETSQDEGEKPKDRSESPDGSGGKSREEAEELFRNRINRYRDTKTTESLKAIISTFNKKNNSGNGCNGYSGIFNPRNVRNENYKYFDRQLSARGNNKFGKFHLNLFIDESGSFVCMQSAANTVINSLVEVEKVNPNFTFDVICDSDGFRETTKDKRFVRANGGNQITYEETMEVMKKHLKKDAYTYNIVLHDGVIDPPRNRGKNMFLAWDRANVTIIDTGDNKRYLDVVKNARIVISPYSQLVNKLGEEIAKALQNAFR